ncbi:MAG: LysR family transcriptional regulator [Qingshengfaniella sp.]
MRFKRLDLNLLVALNHLLTERNVSRAADKLCLSQSATSGALARLRDYFEDDLLVQVGRTMILTHRAQELSVAVRDVLLQVDATVIKRPHLPLDKVQREIRIITSDYIAVSYLSSAIRVLQQQAPGLRFLLIQPKNDPTPYLSRGAADFAVMPERFLSAEHPSQTLFVDGHAAVVCAGNTRVGEELDLDTFLSLRQVTVRLPDGPPNYEQALTDLLGPRRKTDLIVGSFTTVPFMLTGTNRVAIVHDKLARIFSSTMPLRRFPAPLNLPPLRIALQWHGLTGNDPLLEFIRQRLLADGSATP